MKQRSDELDRLLDRTLDGIRNDEMDPRAESEATERVWRRLSQELDSAEPVEAASGRIGSCADFQAMLPGYVAGSLPSARRILVQDHLGECLPCRRRLKQLKAPAADRTVRPARRRGRLSTAGWRLAAAAVIVFALVGFSFKTDVLSFESGGVIRIERIDGELLHFSDSGATPLKAGDVIRLGKGEQVRTAKGSSAVLSLADESTVEMRERSQLAVKQLRHLLPGRRDDGVLGLERGSIIVEASDQGSGHLYVDTDDCRVAVTGTVFSVNHGLKGSRVSVIEGEVHVDYAGGNDVLQPGDQATTHPALTRVPVEREIAWSRNSDRYVELLREVRALGRELDEALRPGSRYATDLLDRAPAGTVIYIGIPNVGEELANAYEILRDRMTTNDLLRQYWDAQLAASDELVEVLEKVRTYSDHLGEEIVVTLGVDSGGNVQEPLVMAGLNSRGAFATLLEQDLAALQENERSDVRVFSGELPAASPTARHGEAFFWMPDDLLVISPSFDRLLELEAVRNGFTDASLVGAAFHDRLAERYADGVEWIVGVDLERLIPWDEAEQLEHLGLSDVQHLIAERRQRDDRTEQQATLTFAQPRRRMAAWLAEPAPMGALDYVGPGANLATAFVVKDLGVLVDELFEMIGKLNPGFDEELARFEREHAIDIRRDFANPLGGEFVMALDGPVLPVPSWKLVVEVYDPARLQQTLEWLVERINEAASGGKFGGVALMRETVGDREIFSLSARNTGLGAHYVFDDGYLVVAATRERLEAALQQRRSGIGLVDSEAFASLLPRDGRVNFSGAFYHNVGPVLGPLSTGFSASGLGGGGNDLLRAMLAEARPGLVLLYGEPDRIELTANAEGGLFSSGLGSLSGFGGIVGMQQSLFEAARSQARQESNGP